MDLPRQSKDVSYHFYHLPTFKGVSSTQRRVPLACRQCEWGAGLLLVRPERAAAVSYEKLGRQTVDRGKVAVDDLPFGSVPPGTRPLPVDSPQAKSPADGILVNVVDRSQNRSFLVQIPIVTRSFLPEPKSHLAGSFPDRQGLQQTAARGGQSLLDVDGHRTLDTGQKPADGLVVG